MTVAVRAPFGASVQPVRWVTDLTGDMGDSFPVLFMVFQWLLARWDCGQAAGLSTSPRRFLLGWRRMDSPWRIVPRPRWCEAYVPAIFGFLKAHGFAGEGKVQIDHVASPLDLSVAPHPPDLQTRLVARLAQDAVPGARGRRVGPSGRRAPQRLVRPILVVVDLELRKDPTLGAQVGRGRRGGVLQQGEVEAPGNTRQTTPRPATPPPRTSPAHPQAASPSKPSARFLLAEHWTVTHVPGLFRHPCPQSGPFAPLPQRGKRGFGQSFQRSLTWGLYPVAHSDRN